MSLNIAKEIAALERMTVGELQEQYVEVFDEAVRSRHRRYLIRRIAWRLQANAEGGLSERALRQAKDLANIADARVTPPKETKPAPPSMTSSGTQVKVRFAPDSRIPPVGGALRRTYKGRPVVVIVLSNGFEYEGERYRSLTAVTKAITGSHVNGFRFFGLGAKP